MLDKPWAYGIDLTKQPRYQPVEDFTCWLALGSINNWNIIHFTNKTTSSEDFDVAHEVVLDGISENMASLAQLGKYGAINAADSTTTGYYVIKYLYEPYTFNNTKPQMGN